jgi:DNA-binding Lrp family transcriptional regulator
MRILGQMCNTSGYHAWLCKEYAELMSVAAYILIQTEVGSASDVATAAKSVDGVVAVDAVTGPYDVLIKVEADSVDELGKKVVSDVQRIGGITRTLTCPVVNL